MVLFLGVLHVEEFTYLVAAGAGNQLKKGIKMAGAVGFEPTNADSKDPCLAAWRRPSVL